MIPNRSFHGFNTDVKRGIKEHAICDVDSQSQLSLFKDMLRVKLYHRDNLKDILFHQKCHT